MKARREVKVALDKKIKHLNEKLVTKCINLKKVRRTIMRKAKMGGMMKKME